MSFVVTKTVPCVKSYPALNGAAIKGDDETLEITYAITSLVALTDTYAVAEYSVTPTGAALAGKGNIEFTYSGSGNPLEEAETALKAAVSA